MADVVIQRVKTTSGSERIMVVTPYHPDFPRKARSLGGVFGRTREGKPAWFFDPRDEQRVRELVKSVYGTTGEEEDDLVDVIVDLGSLDRETGSIRWSDEFWFLGRQILKRWGRDSSVRLGRGVVVLEGEFASSGGSRRNPQIGSVDGIVIEVRDVPRNLADEAIRKHPNSVKIVQRESLCRRLFESYFAYGLGKL